eukprot:13689537-Alexandrium_andersonii.AAC.1
MLTRLGACVALARGCGAGASSATWGNDLRRAAVRTLRPGPPRPGGLPKVLELLPAPTLGQGAPSHCPHLADLSR